MVRTVIGYFAALYAFSAGVGALVSVGLFFVNDDSVFGENSTVFLALSTIVQIAVCIGCIFLARKLLTPTDAKRTSKRSHEQIILDLALLSDGTLSIAEIAARTQLSVAEAKDGIEALTREGVATVEFNEQEDVFYRFPGLGGQSKPSQAQKLSDV